MKKSTILFIGLFSAWADAATTIIGLRYPQIKEGVLSANPLLETGAILGGQVIILYGGEKIKANPKVTHGLALAVTIPAFYAAANNIAHIAIVEAQTYPWKTCPLLYAGSKP